MATIPMGEFGQSRAVPRPSTTRIDNSASGRIGQAYQNAGQALGNVANDFARMQAARDAEGQALAIAKSVNALSENEVQTNGIVAGIESQIADGSLDWRSAVERYDAVQNEREAPVTTGLPPDRLEAFNGALKMRRQAGRDAVQRVADGARRVEFRGQFDTALDILGKLAGEPGADIASLQRRAEQFVPLAQSAGVDEATIAAKVQGFKDKTWENQAKTRVIAARNDPAALTQLEHDLTAEDGYYSGKLDTDRRNVLLNQVLGRRDQVERAARDATDRIEAKADRALVEFEQQIATGVMAPVEAMQAWQLDVAGGTEAQRDRFRELLDDEIELREVRKLSPVEQQQYLQGRRAERQASGATARQVANLHRIETLIEGDQRRLRESPLEHDAMLKGTTVQPLNVQALANGNAEAVRLQLAERMTTLTRMRRQYGPQVGNAPLLQQEAAALSAVLGQASVRQAAQLFGTLNRAIGDPAMYSAAMQQIAPDSPVRAYAGTIYAQQRAGGPPDAAITSQSRNANFGDVAMYLLKGEALLNPGKGGKATDGKATSFPMPPPQQVEQRIAAEVREAFAGRPQEFDVATQAVRAYYAAKSADEGDVSGQLNAGRLRLAIRAVIGERTRYEGRDVLPPWGMPAGEFRDKAESHVQERLKAAGMRDPGNVALMNVRGRDGAYVLVRGIEPLMDANGMPLVIRVGAPR